MSTAVRRGRRRRPGCRSLDRDAAGPGRRPRRAASSGPPTAPTRVSTHGLMRAGRPAAVAMGTAGRRGRRGDATDPADDVPLRRRRVRAGVDPSERRRRCLVRAAPLRARPDPRRRGRRGGRARCGTGRPVTAVLRDDDGRVTRRPRAGPSGETPTCRPRSRSVPTASVRPSRPQVGAPVVRRGQSLSAVLYRYYADMHDRPGTSGPTAVGGGAGSDPDQRRVDLRVRRDDPGPDACAASLRDRARLRDTPRGDSPALADRVVGGGAGRARCAAGLVRPGSSASRWGPGWALVGDAGYLQGPDHHARHHRRAA